MPEIFNAATHFVDRNVAEGRGGHVAIECGDARITYDEVLRHVNRCGNALRGIGVRPEDRVLLLLLDGPEFVYSFFGAIKIGAVPVPLNTLWKPADYQYVIRDSRAAVLIVSAELLADVERIPDADRRSLRHIIVVGGGAEHARMPPFSALRVAGLGRARRRADQPRRAGVLALLVRQHRRAEGLRASAARHGRVRGAVRQRRPRHRSGRPLLQRRQAVLRVRSRQRAVLSVLRRRDDDSLAGGADAAERLRGDREAQADAVLLGADRLRDAARARPRPALGRRSAILQTSDGGISISRPSASRSRPARRCRRRSTIASSSASASTSSTASDRPRRCTCSSRIVRTRFVPVRAGCWCAGYEARLLDDEGDAVLPGEIGNLWIRGDSICAGYWNQHEKTKNTIEGHWIRTGDKYTQDVDGFYWYAGRTDDMLKVGGLWVSPVEVENALVAHAAVLECGVVGREDHDGLIKPMAFVVLRDGATGSPELAKELQQFVRERLAEYKRPRWVEFVAELPKTATGKIQRFKLRQRQAVGSDQGQTPT